MPDLITLSTAENYISTSSPNTTLLASLISNVSQAIVKYCKRDFVSTVRDELYNGNGDRRLCLRHFPIVSIKSVRYRPVTVIKIINNDTATNQQARAQIVSTGVQLTRVASGVPITESLVTFAGYVDGTITVTNGGSSYVTPVVSFSGGGGSGAAATATVASGVITAITLTNAGQGYSSAPTITIADTGGGSGATATCTIDGYNPTLIDVCNVINDIGNGWQAQVVGDSNEDYGLWPSADLWIADGQGQGALTARGAFAEIKMHTYELQGYQWDQRRGWLLRAIPYTDPELLHPEDLVWPVGINNFRVQYTSGFATVPLDVQEACGEWVAALYWQAQRDPGLAHESIPGSVTRVPFSTMPPGVQALLATYRDFKILSFGA